MNQTEKKYMNKIEKKKSEHRDMNCIHEYSWIKEVVIVIVQTLDIYRTITL